MSREAPNGCGPWWVPRSWKDEYFVEECAQHDRDYMQGVDRRKSDRDFYKAMRKKISQEPDRRVRRRQAGQALWYYWIVRVFGWTSHKDGLDI